MPGLGIGMPIEGFFLFVPMLFVVFHVYALLQLVVLARRIGLLKRLLATAPGPVAAGQEVLLSPFAVSQRLFGEPPGLVPRTVLRVSIWFTLVLIPLAVLIATQVRFLPYHSATVTWAHRLYIAIDILLLLLLWPHDRGPARPQRDRATQRPDEPPPGPGRARPGLAEVGRRRLLRTRRFGTARAEPGRDAHPHPRRRCARRRRRYWRCFSPSSSRPSRAKASSAPCSATARPTGGPAALRSGGSAAGCARSVCPTSARRCA